MTGQPREPRSSSEEAFAARDRQRRLAAALRKNLARRKAQLRGRADAESKNDEKTDGS